MLQLFSMLKQIFLISQKIAPGFVLIFLFLSSNLKTAYSRCNRKSPGHKLVINFITYAVGGGRATSTMYAIEYFTEGGLHMVLTQFQSCLGLRERSHIKDQHKILFHSSLRSIFACTSFVSSSFKVHNLSERLK